MKRSIMGIMVLASLWAPLTAWAVGDFKVGFVNVTKVLEKAPQAEDARNRLEKEFAPRDQELVKIQKDIRKLEDKLVRDGAIMSETERGRVKKDLRTRKRELKRQQDDFREDLNLRRNQELGKLQRKVLEAIQSLAKKERYDLIVSDGVIFASKRVDISPRIVELLKTQFKNGSLKKGK